MSSRAPASAVLERLSWRTADERERLAWIDRLRPVEPRAEVAEIIAGVRNGGDAALLALRERLEGAPPGELWASEDEFRAAPDRVPRSLSDALERAAAAVRRYHADQRNALRVRRVVQTAPGVAAWRRWVPLRRVGGYVPGGRAPLASSVLMIGVPARLAGVDELVIATPSGPSGEVAPAILVAARLVGVDRVLKVGGAQAIAALAYGTESVPRVDRIVGAGGGWVTAAKRAVAGDVAIDLPAGPSECVVLADADADPGLVALDLLAQAEHGPDSIAVLVTDAPALIDAVEAALPQVARGPASAGLETLQRHGHAVEVSSPSEALELAEAIAPEHLSLQCRGAAALAERVRRAGSVFIGATTPVAAGDYAIGANHLLPTGGAAAGWSGVGVETFGRWVQLQAVTAPAVSRLAPVVTALAEAEGMSAHAASVSARAVAGQGDERLDATLLLRQVDPVTPYPVEESDEMISAETGLDPDDLLRADLNILGGGPLAGAVHALRDYPADDLRTYGDMSYGRLRATLGELCGVAPSRIIPGAGADELIRLVTGLAAGPGDAVVIPTPTFGMFAVEAELAGARVVAVPRADIAVRQSPDQLRAAALDSSARLVWLCTPNNPTGEAYPLDEVRQLAGDLPSLLAVDEVYLEFAAADANGSATALSAASLQGTLPNVIVVRSLSKAYGLANARVGYLVVPEELVDRFDASRLPLSLSGPSVAMALGVLEDPVGARERQAAMVKQRRRLADAIVSRGWACLPSVTNFVAFRPDDASALAAALRDRGIILRTYSEGPMAGWLRVGAGDAAETDRILSGLEAYR